MTIYQDEAELYHTRKVYNIMDLLGDVGGILEAVTIFLGVFLYPISEFAFVVKASGKLFEINASKSSQNENSQIFDIKFVDKIYLFLNVVFGCPKFKSTLKFRETYDNTNDTLEQYLDIV